MRAIARRLLFNTKPAPIRNITMSESDQAPAFNRPRLVAKKVSAKLQHEGDGAVVRRGIGRYILAFLWAFFVCFKFY
jgi:quercetin 2,3-dioxygenase